MTVATRTLWKESSDFFAHSYPCPVSREVQEEIRRDSAGQIVDPSDLKRQENWSYLLDQVVGGEYPR